MKLFLVFLCMAIGHKAPKIPWNFPNPIVDATRVVFDQQYQMYVLACERCGLVFYEMIKVHEEKEK